MEVYRKRRERLLQQLPDKSVVIMANNLELTRNRDITYPYRPDSNFYYLTGFTESDSLAVITRQTYILSVRPRNPSSEQWDGYRSGLEGAKQIYGADQSYDINMLDQNIGDLLCDMGNVYLSFSANYGLSEKIFKWINLLRLKSQKVKRNKCGPTVIGDLDPILSEMRLIKDSNEIALIRRACEISAQAHVLTMQCARDAKYEYELDAVLKGAFAKAGSLEVAYPNIVASGANSCILHYGTNNARLDPSGLVLIDAGAEYDYYASDITRTFPVNGKFSSEQRQIYQLVLKAQTETIELVKPGANWQQLIDKVTEVLTGGLVELGIIQNPNNKTVAELIDEKTYLPFYMHSHGHWMGLDVHDVGSYCSPVREGLRELREGMVFTVEPGIYIKADLDNVDPKWHNIGVRIEDNILVTSDGYEVLTRQVPKNVDEIESLISRGTA